MDAISLSTPRIRRTPLLTTKRSHNFKDRTGIRFGRLICISFAGTMSNSAAWLCKCDCGKEKIIGCDALRGGVKSCGCSRSTGPGSRPNYKCRLAPGIASKNTLLKQYRGAAKKRGHEWGLTVEQFDAITSSACHYCGCQPSQVKKCSKNGEYIYNGIDRLDNTRGYTVSNVVPCCSACNHAKHVMPLDMFMTWIKRIVSFQSKTISP